MGKGKATTVQRKPGGKSSKKRSIESYDCKGTLINSGDCVLVKVDKSARPNVAKVNKIFEGKKGEVIFSITYYIWPTDTIQGKLSFHGKSEILSSDWYDEVDSKCIDGKCTVHEVEDYKNLANAGPYDFVSRLKYNHIEKSYQEESLPVYCVCLWPFNPDYPMIFCEKCNNWFHPKCVGIDTLSEVKSLPKTWLCPKCRLPESAT